MSVFSTKIYTVHIDPSQTRPYEKPVFVREGFNFFAFIFMFVWALYHRLWLAALLLFIAQGAFMHMEEGGVLSAPMLGILMLALQVLVGFHANDWRRNALQRKGYIMADITTGESLLRAEQRFFERHFAAA